MSAMEKVNKNAPYRLLSLDGGGLRGMITIEILARIELLLQHELGHDDSFVLSDYFDYIAGTSTGAIIATCLSLGMRVDTIREFYFRHGASMFDKASLLRRFHYRYEDERLAKLLQHEIGHDTLLGSDKLRTLLLLIMRNATTDSPWPISNNPQATFNQCHHEDCNLNIPLWQLIRASTAAPTYFPPEVVSLGKHDFVFVDGGVTMYNNPAFQLFLMATIDPYRLMWKPGKDHMLLVSVGTGASADANAALQPNELNLLYNVRKVPAALMMAASVEQDLLCRVFGHCLVGDSIDSELGDLHQLRGPVEPKLFTYLRYNADLSCDGLMELGLADIEPDQVQRLDAIECLGDLQRVGIAAATRVNHTHFQGFLNK